MNILPILTWLPKYERSWLRFDVVAALTTWALVVPQAIAYGQLAGLPPQAGLYGAFAALLAYGLFGTSRQLVVSPTSSTAIVSASLIAPLALGSTAEFYGLSAMLAILVGLVFIVYSLLKLGFVSQFIVKSVQTGLMFGLGLTIIATQLPKVLGIPEVNGNFFAQIANVLQNLSATNWYALAIGVASLAALLILKRVAPRFPAALAVVVGSILLVTILGLTAKGVEVIGLVQTQLPLPSLPKAGFDNFGTLLLGAIAISLIAYAESDTVSEEFANKLHYDIQPNQELLALGASNIAAGLYQGFIVAGGASQTAANESAGAKTQASGLIVSTLILLTTIALMPFFKNLPQSVLGAIVISAVLGFVNVYGMRRLSKMNRGSFVLALITLIAVLFLGVLPGLILAVILSVLALLVFISNPKSTTLGRVKGSTNFVSRTRYPEAEPLPGLLIFRQETPLFAFNAKTFRSAIMTDVRQASSPPRVVLLDLETNGDLDVESNDTLAEIKSTLKSQGMEMWLARVHGSALDVLIHSGLADEIDRDFIFASVIAAADAFEALPETSSSPAGDLPASA